MGELEDQVARLAQHRADQVPPYQAPTSLSSARERHRAAWFVAAAAIVTAIAVVAGALLWDRGDDPSVRTGPSPATELPAPSTVPPTTPPTTPPPTAPPAAACPTEQVDTNPMSGGPSGRTEDAVLVNVQIQTSACVDEVAFAFRGAPDWTVEYRAAPIMLQPQGEPVDVEGAAFLVVRFDHSDAGRAGYTGPRQLRAGPLSHVTEVRMTEDFEAVLTWVIGLDARVPFGVEQRGGQVVVRFPESGTERTVTCTDPDHHLEYTVPNGWFVELSDEFRCLDSGPTPFEIIRQSDAPVPVWLLVSTSGGGAQQGPGESSSVTTSDGRVGSCYQIENNGAGLFPPGTWRFICSVPWGDAGYLNVMTDGYSEPEFGRHKAGVQAIVASARYLP